MTDKEREVLHMEFGWSAKSEMALCLAESSKAFTVHKDRKPVLMFGVIPDNGNGNLWFIGSRSEYSQSVKEFAMKSYAFLPQLSEGFYYVGSVVDSEDKKLARWLEFLGFEKTAEYEEGQAQYLLKV